MAKKENLWVILGSVACVVVVVGVSVGTVLGVRAVQNRQNPPANNETPNINTANTTFTDQFHQIYDLSTPIMFVYNQANNQNEQIFNNGTAWVFDRQANPNTNLITYYLATNLHVINLWGGEEETQGAFPALQNVNLYLGNKNACPEFNQANMVNQNGITNFNWPYIEGSRIGNIFNATKWITSSYYTSYNAIPDTQTSVVNNNGLVAKEIFTPTYGATTAIEQWQIIPFGLNLGLDLGIVQIQVQEQNLSFFPFLQAFDNWIGKKPLNQIYDLNPGTQSNLDISIGGYPAMTNPAINGVGSTWDAWNNSSNNVKVNILEGNNRGPVAYQNMAALPPNTQRSYYGSAPGANLGHGSSGSMVLNNNTGQIEGIYWGGLDNERYGFSGQFIPFGANGVLNQWSSFINQNGARPTFISQGLPRAISNDYYYAFVKSLGNLLHTQYSPLKFKITYNLEQE